MRALVFLTSLLCITFARGGERNVTAAEVNGTYKRHESVIKVLALGHSKLKVKLELVQPFDSPEGPTANMGSAEGEATIEGDTATFQPPDTRTCTITLTFQGNGTLKVTQDAQDVDCGFGHHVRADGTYKKVKGGKPNFEEE